SFGEIALIKEVLRQATIVARTKVRALRLSKQNFDAIFPKGSQERAGLTDLINRVKLIQDSQALSYLTPTQIQTFIRSSKRVLLAKGDVVIRAGDVGDAAYLIESGHIKVVSSGKPVKVLSRGDIFGMISLIKNLPRTADVIAESE